MELIDIKNKLVEILNQDIQDYNDAGECFVREKIIIERIKTQMENSHTGFEILGTMSFYSCESDAMSLSFDEDNENLYSKFRDILQEEYL